MTTSRFRHGLMLLSLLAPASARAQELSGGWQYKEYAGHAYFSAEAYLRGQKNFGTLAINCSHASTPTLSIQFRPDPGIGISFAPVVLDRYPSTGSPLDAKLIWEPDQKGAFARDGIDDWNASEVAIAIRSRPATFVVVSADRDGRPSVARFDSMTGFDAIDKVLTRCPILESPQQSQGS